MDEPELSSAPWFQPEVPKSLSLEVLRREPEGAFVVRRSNSGKGLALSVRFVTVSVVSRYNNLKNFEKTKLRYIMFSMRK